MPSIWDRYPQLDHHRLHATYTRTRGGKSQDELIRQKVHGTHVVIKPPCVHAPVRGRLAVVIKSTNARFYSILLHVPRGGARAVPRAFNSPCTSTCSILYPASALSLSPPCSYCIYRSIACVYKIHSNCCIYWNRSLESNHLFRYHSTMLL
jgi:hypothetical protein